MALAQALAPEGVGIALRQQGFAHDAVDGEHAGIPACGNQGCGFARLRGRIHGGEVFRNAGMGVKAIDQIECSRQGMLLYSQIIFGAAAEDEDIQLALLRVQSRHFEYRRAGVQGLNLCRWAAAEYTSDLHIGVLRDGSFYPAP